jgi:actin-related protein
MAENSPPKPSQSQQAPMIHNVQDLVPKLIIHQNAQVKLPPEMMASTSKRRSDEFVSQEVKKEKCSPPKPEIICLDDNHPIDMSTKKTKVVIEFNNINDITQQLPLMDVARTSAESKNAAVIRISEELKKLDEERINLDEQRLQLEIKRNEVDKAAYTLTQLLGQVANA